MVQGMQKGSYWSKQGKEDIWAIRQFTALDFWTFFWTFRLFYYYTVIKKCKNPKEKEVIINGNHLFRVKTPNPCIK